MTIPRQDNTMINHKQIAAFSLFILLIGYFSPIVASEKPIAPMLYVERCSFKFEGNNCGQIAKNVIFFSSDEFLTFTDYWAVGRVGKYKQYISCLSPHDNRFTDGSLTLISLIVAGPDLNQAHEMAKQLLSDFSEELPEESGNISHCTEK